MERGESIDREISRAREFLSQADHAANGGNSVPHFRMNLARALDSILSVIEREGEIQAAILEHLEKPLWRRLRPPEWAFILALVVVAAADAHHLIEFIAGVLIK